jgi:PPM family protein phosphatase
MPNSSSPIRPTDPGLTPLTVSTGFLTDTGPTRASNEDSVAVVSPSDIGALLTKGILALVADGMGGHEGGEVASAIAAHRVPEIYYGGKAGPQESLLAAFEAANHDIFEVARKNGKLTGMGTTCTAVAIVNGMAYLAHAGDSRAYLLRGGQIYCMTEDHSATMAMVKQDRDGLPVSGEHRKRLRRL